MLIDKRLQLYISLTAFIFITGCANKNPETMQVCNSMGCAEQATNYSSYNPDVAVPSDDPENRIPMLEDLARQDPRAAFDLALRYFRGDGIRQDSYKALQWMRDAAERGDLNAQKALGRFYLTGLEEMGSDPREAEKWLGIAASRGDREAAKLLKEAQALRQDDDEYYQWANRWRPIFYNSWYSGYRYNWGWNANRWYLY